MKINKLVSTKVRPHEEHGKIIEVRVDSDETGAPFELILNPEDDSIVDGVIAKFKKETALKVANELFKFAQGTKLKKGK